MRVKLIVTGDLEKLALGESLGRALHSSGAKVEFLSSRKLGDGAVTTTPLPPLTVPQTPTTVRRMARALITETLESPRKGDPLPDLVVGVDDLELANAHQPQVVVDWIRRGVQEEIKARTGLKSEAALVEEELRKRCSFHLLAPLAEAYFFGEPAALLRAGVADGTPMHLTGTGVEDFETHDPAFLPRVASENAGKAALGASWWREEKHPKRYLEFLVGASGRLYDETRGGVQALRTLDWPVMTSSSALHFARALFEDISRGLGVPNPLGSGACSPFTYPSKAVRPGMLTLRNL